MKGANRELDFSRSKVDPKPFDSLSFSVAPPTCRNFSIRNCRGRVCFPAWNLWILLRGTEGALYSFRLLIPERCKEAEAQWTLQTRMNWSSSAAFDFEACRSEERVRRSRQTAKSVLQDSNLYLYGRCPTSADVSRKYAKSYCPADCLQMEAFPVYARFVPTFSWKLYAIYFTDK